jgi:hypothetical protein
MAGSKKIDEWLEKGKGGYTVDELRDAFRKVANNEYWKYDVDAVVPDDLKDVLQYAVPWNTGGPVEIVDLGDGTIHVTAPGYFSNGMEG